MVYTVNVISLLQASQWYRTPGSTRPGLAAFFLITPIAGEAKEGVICAGTGRAQSVLLRRVVYRMWLVVSGGGGDSGMRLW